MEKGAKNIQKIGIRNTFFSYTDKRLFFPRSGQGLECDPVENYIADSMPAAQPEAPPDLTQWLCVSGDIDDFIYYGEEPRHSER